MNNKTIDDKVEKSFWPGIKKKVAAVLGAGVILIAGTYGCGSRNTCEDVCNKLDYCCDNRLVSDQYYNAKCLNPPSGGCVNDCKSGFTQSEIDCFSEHCPEYCIDKGY